MQKLLYLSIIVVLSLTTTSCSMQYGAASVNKYVAGYWGNWQNIQNWMARGSIGDLIVYHPNQHPSDYCFKLYTDNPPIFSSDDVKHGKWYTCSGYIEYHYYTEFPKNFKVASKDFVNLDLPSLRCRGDKILRRPATIKIYKDKDVTTYNVFFDDVGFGFSRSNGKLKMTSGAKTAIWSVLGGLGAILLSAVIIGAAY